MNHNYRCPLCNRHCSWQDDEKTGRRTIRCGLCGYEWHEQYKERGQAQPVKWGAFSAFDIVPVEAYLRPVW